MNKYISVLGCGWLGLPLSTRLIANGWTVKGSTTDPNKLKLLSHSAIDPYLVQLNNLSENIASTFLKSDVLLINVPPSLKKQSPVSYLEQMRNLLDVVEKSQIGKVIFISSTSVYPELNKIVNGTAGIDEESVLLKSERLFTQSKAFKTTVIRFAGLIGPGRHPSRFFSGRTNIPNGNAPVNLIHLEDCIAIIETILDSQTFGEIYHAAAPSHPSRSQFYRAAAQHAGLALPGFVDELNEWKIISPEKLVQELNYQFIYPDLLASLAAPNF